MIRMPLVALFFAVLLGGQSSNSGVVSVGVATEAARCEAIAPESICLGYSAPLTAETPGVFEPGTAAVRVSGPDAQPVSVYASVISPVGRQWLQVRAIGETGGSNSVSGVLPFDFEVFADESQLAETKAGRFIATLVVVTGGKASALKMPVQLTVTATTEAIRAEPDSIPALHLTAAATTPLSRFTIGVARSETEPPVHISVTPEASDGGNWLSAVPGFGGSQCADQPAPCAFEAVVQAPALPGEYWGVLVITGDGLADRVTVRVKVDPAPQAIPVTIEPRQVSLSAPLGSRYAIATTVTLKGGNRDGVLYRATTTDPWLAVEPPIGTWPVSLRVVMSPLGLEPGVYTDIVVLRAVDTNEVLAAIPVRFNIVAPVFAPSALDGGGWRTRIYLVNPTPVEARATLKFWTAASPASTGSPWLVGLENRGLLTTVDEVLPPGGLRVIETQGVQSRTQQGWVEMTADGPVSMHTVLAESKAVTKWLPVEATVPMLNPYRDQILLPFDNLGGGTTSISLANADDEAIAVDVTILNENGAEVAKEGSFKMAAHEGSTIALAERWTSSAGRRGLVSLRFDGGRLFALGIRSREKGFHTYPAVACAEVGLERALPSVSAGGIWQSTAYLANTTPTSQMGLLRLWPDRTRFAGEGLSDEAAPVVPGNGILMWQAPCKDASKAAAGWLESRYTKQVNGFMLLRQSYAGSPAGTRIETYEAALGGLRGLTGRVAIPFDNRENYSTRIVLINPSDTPADIQPVLYDLAGRYPRFLDAFRLPAKGQLSVNAADRWELGAPQGILEFSNRQGVALTGVGLRFGEGALSILPAYEK